MNTKQTPPIKPPRLATHLAQMRPHVEWRANNDSLFVKQLVQAEQVRILDF